MWGEWTKANVDHGKLTQLIAIDLESGRVAAATATVAHGPDFDGARKCRGQNAIYLHSALAACVRACAPHKLLETG